MHDVETVGSTAAVQPGRVGSTSVQDARQDGWMTLAEAATYLSVSTDTIRRRLKRGELEAQQVPTPYGPAWRVRVGRAPGVGSIPPGNVSGVGSAAVQEQSEGLLEALRLVRELQQQNVELAGAAGMWQARAEFLAGQVDQLQRALEAPRQPEPAPGFTGANSDGTPVEPARPSTKPKRPWWRFW